MPFFDYTFLLLFLITYFTYSTPYGMWSLKVLYCTEWGWSPYKYCLLFTEEKITKTFDSPILVEI